MKRRVLLCVAWSFFCLAGWADEPTTSGLVVEFRNLKAGTSDFRLDRRPALLVENGEAPTPLLPPGPFEATWRGILRLEKRERLYFSFDGFGKASLIIDEKVILEGSGEDLSTEESERLRLNGGDHALEIRYLSAESGAGRLRLFWRGRDFTRETISPKAYAHSATGAFAQSATKAASIKQGRFLTAVHGCVKCHQPDKSFDSDTAMPEVIAKAPSLLGVGSRLREEWMAKWILNPRQSRPSARMPKVIDSIEEAKHIARFLAEMKIKDAKMHSLVGDVSKGGALFAELGCINCHRIDREKAADFSDRISLFDVGSKFLPGALAAFLRAPGQHYPWTRMPDFKLSPIESEHLSVFLRSLAPPAASVDFGSGDLAKGKALFVARGCAACHESPVKNTLEAPIFSALSPKNGKGCLVNAPKGPRYGFSPVEINALSSFLQSGEKSLHQRNSQEFAIRQFKELHCISCHERDGIDSQWGTFANEVSAWKQKKTEDADDQANPVLAHLANRVPPSLTFAGEKFRHEWLTSFLSGEIRDKPRPWMHARMPSFPARAKLLADGLSHACGVSPEERREEAVADLPVVKKVGSQIADVLCITCHGIADREPTAVFEGQGINLLVSRQRLRKEHYLRWMMNPYRINPATIMPKFADEEGRTGLIDLLEGDAQRQFDGIWRHLKDLSIE